MWQFAPPPRRLACVLIVGTLAVAGCREGDIKVSSLQFQGNSAVPSSRLKALLATKSSGWLPWSPKQYFDRAEFETDLNRLRRFYQDRGYPDARLTNVDVALNDTRDAVSITITIAEGEPVIAEAVRFEGFDGLTERARGSLDSAPLKAGQPRDREQVTATRQRGIDLFRDNGFAYGAVEVVEMPGSAPKRVLVTFRGTAGPATTFGPVSYVGLSRITDNVVGRELSFRTGQAYRLVRVVQSQRRLATLPILQFVNIDARPPEGPQVTEIPVTVTVAENKLRRLALGAGYGSEDRLRGSATWSHLNFLGNARQVTVTSKWSSLDRGLRLNLMQPYLYMRGLSLDASANTWWVNEDTYTSRTFGGRLGVVYRLTPRGRGTGPVGRAAGRAPADVFRFAYVNEHLQYRIRPDELEDLADFEERIALGLDPITGEGRGTKAALAFEVERNASDSVLDPHRGYVASFKTEFARPGLGGTFDYTEYLVEGRGYIPFGEQVVLAGRARYGLLRANVDSALPFSERYFLGGSTSLRGWGRYQVAPLSEQGLPVGGRVTFDTSLELRVPVRGPLGAVVFWDGGNVWASSASRRLSDLRHDAGFGLRYNTPIGLVRGDIGVQLNPIDGLVINGEPERRRWRLHFSIGQAF